MIFNGSEPITFNDDLPAQVDVAIIGGGVAGISTAWYLAERGISVMVFEKGRVACEQSSRNWGWVRQQGRDADELPIMIDAINGWETINRTVGNGIGFQRTGVLYLADTDADLASFEQWLDVARPYQLDTKMVSASEVNQMVQDNSGNWKGGMLTASDGRAEPFTAVPSMAQHLHGAGRVKIREHCAVRSLDLEAGAVSGVWTEHGLVRANAVMLSGGAWSSRFLGNHDIRLPQLTVRSTVARTAPVESFYDGGAGNGGFAFRRREDGGYTIAPGGYSEHYVGLDSVLQMRQWLPVLRESFRSVRLRFDGDLMGRLLPKRHWSRDAVSPFEETRVLNPAPSPAALAHARKHMAASLPQLATVPFEESWAGMIDVTPDVVPVLDAVDSHPGLFVATGFSGHGFGFGPGAGQVMANLITGSDPGHDLSRFRYQRFFDGTPMKPGPGL